MPVSDHPRLGPAIEQIMTASDEQPGDCEMCIARARVYVTFATSAGGIGLLLFCTHHAAEVHANLVAKHPDAVFTEVAS